MSGSNKIYAFASSLQILSIVAVSSSESFWREMCSQPNQLKNKIRSNSKYRNPVAPFRLVSRLCVQSKAETVFNHSHAEQTKKGRTTRFHTLNSSRVKFTKQTPHHGSMVKSTGCVGNISFAMDLFSFHIIFWKFKNRQVSTRMATWVHRQNMLVQLSDSQRETTFEKINNSKAPSKQHIRIHQQLQKVSFPVIQLMQ